MPDDLLDHEVDEFFGELRIQVRQFRQFFQAFHHSGFPRRIRRRKIVLRLQPPDMPRLPEPLAQRVDQDGVQPVDGIAMLFEYRVRLRFLACQFGSRPYSGVGDGFDFSKFSPVTSWRPFRLTSPTWSCRRASCSTCSPANSRLLRRGEKFLPEALPCRASRPSNPSPCLWTSPC